MNRLGLTHIAVWVSDIDAVARRVVEYGGTLVEETRTVFAHPKLQGKWLICCDPNGVRVELVEYPEGERILERQPEGGRSCSSESKGPIEPAAAESGALQEGYLL